jgi:hypothetical protein
MAGTGFVPDAAGDRASGAERTRLVPRLPRSKEDHLVTGTRPRTVSGLTTALALVLVAACATPGPVEPSASGPAPSAPAASPSATTLVASAPGWRTDPIIVKHEPDVPPVPVITGIRYAGHPEDGYDRIVFDIEGGLPGYSARYVDEVRADPSDRRLSVPGKRYLLIVFTPAQAHRDDGDATVRGVHRAGLPMLTSYAVAGDVKGHVSIALGLSARTGFRIGELPGRIYIDVAT